MKGRKDVTPSRPAISDDAKFRLAVRNVLLAGLAAAPSAAFAQTTTDTAQTTGTVTGETTGEATELDVLEVTGTRLPQLNVTSTSPVLLVGEEEIKFQGTLNIETLINSMPQAFAEFSTGDSNGATGTATVNLRGLGSSRTLVLIDGKRMMPGDPLLSPSAPNLNFIPAPLVQDIQILTGGASAVYGSDAIAGVVNFIMRKDFEGFRLDAQQGRTAHGDSGTREYYGVWGTNFGNGQGNATVYAGYTKMNKLTQDMRDFSACSITTPGSGNTHVCAGSRTIAEGLIYSYDDGYHLIDPAGSRTFIPDDGRTFNFAPYNYFQRPTERYNIGGFANREVNENLGFYASAMFMDDRTVAAVAPSGLFFVDVAMPCNNPFMSAQQRTELCTDNGYALTDTVDVLVAKRTVELGPREADIRHTDYRIVAGMEGNLPFAEGMTYDLSVQRSEDIYAASQNNYVNTENARNGLAVTDDGAGNPVCASGDAGCVPIDLFQLGALTPDMVDFMKVSGFQQANMIEEIVTGAVTADLGRYGVQWPWATSGIAVAAGLEYRSEYLNYRPDELVAQGQLGGGGGPSPGVSGKYGVHEIFGEMRAPLIENAPFAHLLQFDAAYRHGSYSSSAGNVDSLKGGLQYMPTPDLALRASFQRATRAPQITELFSPRALGLFAGSDPCSGKQLTQDATPLDNTDGAREPNPNAPTQAQCANTGVSAADYTAGISDTDHSDGAAGIQDCVAGQCNGFFGGTPTLGVEESTTQSFGVVFTPSFVKDLVVTIDYFDIEIEDAILALPPTVTLAKCLETGDPTVCNFIHRNATTGTIWGEPTNPNVGFVDAFNDNLATFNTSGIDIEADYKVGMADLGLGERGRLSFTYVTTLLLSLEQEVAPNSGVYDCSGLYGITCGVPAPEYRHKFRTSWYSPFGLTLSANWRYIGETDLDKNTSDPNLQSGTPNFIDGTLEAKNYFDLTGTMALPWTMGVAKALNLRAGITNVFDEQPQVVSSNDPNPVSSPPFGNGNTFPNLYDVFGTSFFLGLTADF